MPEPQQPPPEPQQQTEAQQPQAQLPPERVGSTLKVVALVVAALLAGAVSAASIVMVRLDRKVDAQLATGPFAGTFNYYSAPSDFSSGDAISESDVVDLLRRHGYRESAARQPRSWQETTAGLVVNAPSLPRPVLVRFKDDKIAGIAEIGASDTIERVDLEPALVTNLSGD